MISILYGMYYCFELKAYFLSKIILCVIFVGGLICLCLIFGVYWKCPDVSECQNLKSAS